MDKSEEVSKRVPVPHTQCERQTLAGVRRPLGCGYQRLGRQARVKWQRTHLCSLEVTVKYPRIAKRHFPITLSVVLLLLLELQLKDLKVQLQQLQIDC